MRDRSEIPVWSGFCGLILPRRPVFEAREPCSGQETWAAGIAAQSVIAMELVWRRLNHFIP
jgi:hypothetical protein